MGLVAATAQGGCTGEHAADGKNAHARRALLPMIHRNHHGFLGEVQVLRQDCGYGHQAENNQANHHRSHVDQIPWGQFESWDLQEQAAGYGTQDGVEEIVRDAEGYWSQDVDDEEDNGDEEARSHAEDGQGNR